LIFHLSPRYQSTWQCSGFKKKRRHNGYTRCEKIYDITEDARIVFIDHFICHVTISAGTGATAFLNSNYMLLFWLTFCHIFVN